MIEVRSIDEPEFRQPRRVLKYVLIWCASGSIQVAVDEHDFTLPANSVITVTSGQVHHVKKVNKAKGLILEFTFDFFCKNDHDLELIFHNGLFCHFAMNEVIALGTDALVEEQLHQIQEELVGKPYQYLFSVHSRIELILVQLNRLKIQEGAEIYKPDAVFLKFLELTRSSFKKNMSVRQLAGKLGTTESKLNELSRLHTGKTAQNVIYGLVASEAKRILQYEQLSVKETAFALGFTDPFYFSNFFKKHTGVSPKVYRERYDDK